MSGRRGFNELRDKTPEGRARVAAYERTMRAVMRLAELRAERGVTQDELARGMDVSQDELARGMDVSQDELARGMDVSQDELARGMDVSQDELARGMDVSQIERKDNLYLSTIHNYVEALGGQLRLRAVFPDQQEIDLDVLLPKEGNSVAQESSAVTMWREHGPAERSSVDRDEDSAVPVMGGDAV